MDSAIKILAALALIAITFAAGVYVVRNSLSLELSRPGQTASNSPAVAEQSRQRDDSRGQRQSGPDNPDAVKDAAPSVITTEAGFEPLFNGRDLTGWTGGTSLYSVENGSLVYAAGARGNLYTVQQHANFDLRFDYKLTAGADNGIAIRTPQSGDPGYVGMEIQLLDESAERFRTVAPWQSNGSVCGIVAAKQGFQKPVGEWNSEEIIARGSQITVVLNGFTIIDADVHERNIAETLDGKSHPGLARARGYIALMGDTPRVEFRNIRLKDLGDIQ
jgi:hypothetical protein